METVIPKELLFKVTTWVWWEWLLCPVTDHFSSQLMDDIEDQILSNPLKYFWTLTCVPCSTHLLCFLCENLKLNPYLNLNYICHLCISIFCNVWLFLNHLLVWKIIYTNQFGCLNRDENNNRKESNRPPYITQRDVTSNGGWLVVSFLDVCWVVCGMSCSPDEMHQTLSFAVSMAFLAEWDWQHYHLDFVHDNNGAFRLMAERTGGCGCGCGCGHYSHCLREPSSPQTLSLGMWILMR